MTEPFDWAGLATEAYDLDILDLADFLRQRIEAAFVPVERYEQRGKAFLEATNLANQQAACAEAAEARVKALEEALQRIDDLDSKDEGDMPMMEAAAWNGALEVCRTIAFKALGGEHDG